MPRPTVTGIVAMTLDGKIATRDRDDATFSSPADRRLLNETAARADAVVTGAATVRALDPTLRVTPRSLLRGRPEPLRAILSRSGLLGPDLRIFGPGPKTVVFTSEYASPAARRALEAVTDVRVSKGIDVTAKDVVEGLAAGGARKILVEGGGEVLWTFISQDLLDELLVTVCPVIAGGRSAPTPVDGEGFEASALRRAKLVSCRRRAGELFLRYRLR